MPRTAVAPSGPVLLSQAAPLLTHGAAPAVKAPIVQLRDTPAAPSETVCTQVPSRPMSCQAWDLASLTSTRKSGVKVSTKVNPPALSPPKMASPMVSGGLGR